jgi:NAD(P)H dehydrogenase (quinone)
MYAITGASGRLGRLALESLLGKVEPTEVVALARNPAKLAKLAALGVDVRAFDYDSPKTLHPALEGVKRLLLISGSDVGQRERQHGAVIDAAKRAGVGFLAYTSILHADSNPIGLASEHRSTEADIKESGLTYAILRHGWYTENFTSSAAIEIEQGQVIGSAGNGRISTAARTDYAAAVAAVLTDEAVANQTYELAGDEGYTFAEYAAALADASGKPVTYVDMPEAEYRRALERAGVPGHWAAILAQGSAKAAGGAMFDDGRALSRLIGRPTIPMRTTLKEAIGA